LISHYNKERIKRFYNYDPSKENSIFSKAKELLNKNISEAISASPYRSRCLNPRSKGDIGNIIQECCFGLPANSSELPDFPEAKIELKIIPLERTSQGLTVKERTKICSINYHKLIKEIWPSSHAKRKLNKILFIYYEYNALSKLDSKIKFCDMWALNKIKEQPIIRSDWEVVKKKVEQGLAHELSETLSRILAATRSGSGGVDQNGIARDLTTQPNSRIPALRRAFSIKQSYTNQRWLELFKKDIFESIIDTLPGASASNFEDKVLKKLWSFKGQKLGDFANKLKISIPSGKNAAAAIIKKAIGFKNVNSRIKEFDQIGTEVRVLPIRTKDHKPWEAVSFSQFKFKEVIKEAWEDSELLQFVDSILFIPIYRKAAKTPLSQRVIGKAFLWKPTKNELETIQEEWSMYLDEIKSGKAKPRKIKSGSKTKEVTSLSKESNTKIIHIRPHAKNRKDRDEDQFGNRPVKHSFWLNKAFVHELLRKNV